MRYWSSPCELKKLQKPLPSGQLFLFTWPRKHGHVRCKRAFMDPTHHSKPVSSRTKRLGAILTSQVYTSFIVDNLFSTFFLNQVPWIKPFVPVSCVQRKYVRGTIAVRHCSIAASWDILKNCYDLLTSAHFNFCYDFTKWCSRLLKPSLFTSIIN